MDLVHAVGWCIDARSYEVLAQITTEKFQLDKPKDRVEGRAKFIDFLKAGTQFRGLRHQNTNILLRSIDLTNAIAVSHLSLIKDFDVAADTTHDSGTGSNKQDSNNSQNSQAALDCRSGWYRCFAKRERYLETRQKNHDQMSVSSLLCQIRQRAKNLI
jgi:hypothetical protein